MMRYQLLVLAITTIFISLTQAILWDTSNFGLDVLQLASKYGYPAKKYDIITEDGYILQMERIPYGRKGRGLSGRPAVLLVPGLLSGSVVYANFGPKKSLAFILADNGYDVWLLNYRGTTYSRRHVYLNPDVDKKQYWNYSFVEIGAYDTPAAIDKVLLETKQKSLFYVGHSIGNSYLYALIAEQPEYNQKVKLMMSLAPAMQLNNTKHNIFTAVGKFATEIEFFADLYQTYEVLPSSFIIQQFGNIFCSDISIFQDLCANIFLFMVGYSPDELDKSQLPVIISTTPAGASVKSILHSTQLYKTGRFAKYDYGYEENLLHYGQEIPPLYDVSKVSVPIALFYGGKDALVSEADIEDDARLLPNVISKTLFKNFNHVDFTWAIDAPSLLYPKIVNLMNGFR